MGASIAWTFLKTFLLAQGQNEFRFDSFFARSKPACEKSLTSGFFRVLSGFAGSIP